MVPLMAMVAERNGRSCLMTLPMARPLRSWMLWATARAVTRPAIGRGPDWLHREHDSPAWTLTNRVDLAARSPLITARARASWA